MGGLNGSALSVEHAHGQEACLASDLFCSRDDIVHVCCVSEQESFCIYRLASDPFEGLDCAVSCCCGEDHLSVAVLLHEVFGEVLCGRQLFFCVVDLHLCDPVLVLVQGELGRADVACGFVAQLLDQVLCLFDVDCFVHGVSFVKAERFSRSENSGAAVSGVGASSQVSPDRAPQALSRSERRLDGSSGAELPPAQAGDALAASTPRNFRPQTARAVAIRLGDLACGTGSELVRRASWDAAPLDVEGVPC